MIDTLEKMKQASPEALLDLYASYVRVDHYDPFDTPKDIEVLIENNIRLEDIEKIILERMYN